jgi:hypothetical protein
MEGSYTKHQKHHYKNLEKNLAMLQKLEALRDEEKNPNMPCQQTLT